MKSRRKRAMQRGLPREIIFGHLRNIPPGRVGLKFLENNVWWWRRENYKFQFWIQDELNSWPECNWLRSIISKMNPTGSDLSREEAEHLVEQNGHILERAIQNPEGAKILDAFWAGEIDPAMAYELRARVSGAYPSGSPYICLTTTERCEWKKYLTLDLNHEPCLWREGDSTVLLDAMVPVEGKMIAYPWTQRFRFNLLQPDGYIVRALRAELDRERARLSVPDPGPNNQNRWRRVKPPSWAHIENIDIRAHCSDQKTSSRTRQAAWRKCSQPAATPKGKMQHPAKKRNNTPGG